MLWMNWIWRDASMSATESQVRPLSKLNLDQQLIAWQKVIDTAPEGGITARHVSKVVREITGGPDNSEGKGGGLSSELSSLMSAWKRASKKDRKEFLTWIEE